MPERRLAAGLPTALIAIHSYTPVYFGKSRPWHVGIVFDDDRRMADLLIRALKADPALNVGVNEPYSPADQVYYTVSRHAGQWDLPAAMIEIRNDEIGDEAGQRVGRTGSPDFYCGEPRLVGASHALREFCVETGRYRGLGNGC